MINFYKLEPNPSTKFQIYSLNPSAREYSCADVTEALRRTARGYLALGYVGRSLLYHPDDGSLIGISFVPNPNLSLDIIDMMYPSRMKGNLQDLFNDLRTQVDLIFQPGGIYEKWSALELAKRGIFEGEEFRRKAEMQIAFFEELIGIFSYSWRKIDLEALLRQA